MRRALILLSLLAVAAMPLIANRAEAAAETIAIIGTGRVGSALGPRLATLGHKVIYGSRTPDSDKVRKLVARTGNGARADLSGKAARAAGIILLATPWPATEGVVRDLGDLRGKIVLDATNPLEFRADRSVGMAVDTSAGELIQGWIPQAKVIKAFNTVGFSVMAKPESAGGPITIPLVGNDVEAKKRVAEIVTALGFEAADLGGIAQARWVEGMAILYVTPFMTGRPEQGFEFYLRKKR